MSSTNRTSTVLTIAGVTAVSGILAYALYFDYKRRNDVSFRKKLRKEKKKVVKTAAQAAPESTGSTIGHVSDDEIRVALEKVRAEEVPPTPQEKEEFFLSQVQMGEQLCVQGPAYQLPAAMCFYRGLRVYPSPVELLMIYQNTVPEPIFKIVMQMMNMDVSEPSSSTEHAEEGHLEVSEEETSPSRRGPPSETSSQEWDKVTDPDSQPAVST